MKKIAGTLLILFLSLLYSAGFGGFEMPKQQKFLKPTEAFKVDAQQNLKELTIHINLADKIHIYKKKLTFTVLKPIRKELHPTLPKGKIITGEEA